jgi:bacteriochlorophyllide c C-7(1)-hydroxylase
MPETRAISEEDVYLKARMLSEGVHMTDMDLLAAFKENSLFGLRPFVLDESGMEAAMVPNKYSRLKVTIDGEKATVSDAGDVLGVGHLMEFPSWLDEPLSNGNPASSSIDNIENLSINIQINNACYNWQMGTQCRYCGLYEATAAEFTHEKRLELAALRAETLKIATDNGWRGVLIVGGAQLSPSRRTEVVDRIEMFLTPIREAIGEEVFSEIIRVVNNYPPKDLSEMYKWKELGINGTSFDVEIMDPAFFAAVCPGKADYAPHEFWLEAQNASTEIFDWTTTGLVVGLEPMQGLLEGMEDRVANGVLPLPFSFLPAPGSTFERFRPPNADWIFECADKAADIFIRHASQDLLNQLVGESEGKISGGNPIYAPINVAGDLIILRLLRDRMISSDSIS